MELVWVRVRWRETVFELIWEKITRCLNPTWHCLNPTWQSSGSAIIKLSQNDGGFFCANSDLESVSEFEKKLRWLREDDCQQVKWEWMSLSQIELVWVRVRLWECFWVNLREDNKVSESKMNPTWQNSRWLLSSSWVRMNKWTFLCKRLNPR